MNCTGLIVFAILLGIWISFNIWGDRKEKHEAKNEKIKWPKAW